MIRVHIAFLLNFLYLLEGQSSLSKNKVTHSVSSVCACAGSSTMFCCGSIVVASLELFTNSTSGHLATCDIVSLATGISTQFDIVVVPLGTDVWTPNVPFCARRAKDASIFGCLSTHSNSLFARNEIFLQDITIMNKTPISKLHFYLFCHNIVLLFTTICLHCRCYKTLILLLLFNYTDWRHLATRTLDVN